MGGDDRPRDGEPEARTRTAGGAVELVEEPLGLRGGEAGPLVADLDHRFVSLAARGHLDRRPPPWRRAFSSRFTSACSTSTASIATSGRSGATCASQALLAGVALDARERGADDLLERVPVAAGLQSAGLEPGHVEQVAHQAVEPLGLVEDRRCELARLRGRRRGVLAQRAGCAGDRRERRAQVMGDGAQERAAQLLRLGGDARLLRLGGETRSLEGCRDLARERRSAARAARARAGEPTAGSSIARTPSAPWLPTIGS